MHFRLRATFALLALLGPGPALAQFAAPPGTGPGLAETVEAIDSARVTTRILYITAHPDDESGATLSYLARGRHAEVALLSLTRGEGGQNALGPEQAPQLGLIRTRELLAATRGYGARLYFTRARDFGYSKTPEETMKVWGDAVLLDMVRVLRRFRPAIVINNWGGVHSGHGHHQAAGLLTPRAVAAAADGSFCAECGAAWKVEQILDLERGSEKPTGYILPLDEVSGLWGKSWREIGIDAFASHRTQGVSVFLGSPFLRRPTALKREDGGVLEPESLARPLTNLLGSRTCQEHPDWCDRLRAADGELVRARAAALALDWKTATEALGEAERNVKRLWKPDTASSPGPLEPAEEAEAREAAARIVRAELLAAGLRFTAEAERADVPESEEEKVAVRYSCRPGVPCPVAEGSLELWGQQKKGSCSGNAAGGWTCTISLGKDKDRAWPEALFPEGAATVTASLRVGTDPDRASVETIPVVHTEASSTGVERVPVRLVPAYSVLAEPRQAVELLSRKHQPFDVYLRVHSYSTASRAVAAGLDVPPGWASSAPVELRFAGVGDSYARFTVTPPPNLAAGNYRVAAYARSGEQRFTTSLEPLASLATELWEEPARVDVHAFDITVPEHLRVGYISAENEPVPEALRRAGVEVELLDGNAVNFGDLGRFDAVVVGVRAYELRPELAGANQRLVDYVSRGGTLVVEYQRDFAWDGKSLAPYPAKIGNPTPRITDETSEIRFLEPGDSLLHRPNQLTPADFSGWIQERGLYFWSEFDPRYTALLAMHDPGESDLTGGLVYARYGKGTYIYTALAFFRELPEGVSGAYRLFVNLLSASRAH